MNGVDGDSDGDDFAVCLDGQGRIAGSAAACDCDFGVWDHLLRATAASIEAIRTECHLAAWPLASGSFWLPADAQPATPLERLAAAIFHFHVRPSAFDAANSGAEWWANISDSETMARKENSYGEIAMHFDKDEGANSQLNLFVHPLLSTVTYLTDDGAPTLVLPNVTVSSDGQLACTETPICEAKLVPPRVGRHACFDGRWLHGAPAVLCPSTSKPYRRITFCVNLWVGHKPAGCNRFSASSKHVAPAAAKDDDVASARAKADREGKGSKVGSKSMSDAADRADAAECVGKRKVRTDEANLSSSACSNTSNADDIISARTTTVAATAKATTAVAAHRRATSSATTQSPLCESDAFHDGSILFRLRASSRAQLPRPLAPSPSYFVGPILVRAGEETERIELPVHQTRQPHTLWIEVPARARARLAQRLVVDLRFEGRRPQDAFCRISESVDGAWARTEQPEMEALQQAERAEGGEVEVVGATEAKHVARKRDGRKRLRQRS